MIIITDVAEYHIINFKKKTTVKELTSDLGAVVAKLEKNNPPAIRFHAANIEGYEEDQDRFGH